MYDPLNEQFKHDDRTAIRTGLTRGIIYSLACLGLVFYLYLVFQLAWYGIIAVIILKTIIAYLFWLPPEVRS